MPSEKTNLLTTGQAAVLCSVTPDTILKWIKKGQLSGTRTAGGHYRIDRGILESLIASSRSGHRSSPPFSDHHGKSLRCWEYLSDRGTVRDACRECVMYRVEAARCFMMAGPEHDVGHGQQFCENSCEACVYYRRVTGLASNILVITRDDALVGALTDADDKTISVRFASNTYEASAIIQDFRPAFVVIDVENLPGRCNELVDSLSADSRLPGVGVIIATPSGKKKQKRLPPEGGIVVSIVEKPISGSRLAAVVNSSCVARPPMGNDLPSSNHPSPFA